MEEDVFPSKIIFEMKNTKVIKKKKKTWIYQKFKSISDENIARGFESG